MSLAAPLLLFLPSLSLPIALVPYLSLLTLPFISSTTYMISQLFSVIRLNYYHNSSSTSVVSSSFGLYTVNIIHISPINVTFIVKIFSKCLSHYLEFVAMLIIIIHPTFAAAQFSCSTPQYMKICPQSYNNSPCPSFFPVRIKISTLLFSNSEHRFCSFPFIPRTFHVAIFHIPSFLSFPVLTSLFLFSW